MGGEGGGWGGSAPCLAVKVGAELKIFFLESWPYGQTLIDLVGRWVAKLQNCMKLALGIMESHCSESSVILVLSGFNVSESTCNLNPELDKIKESCIKNFILES